MTESLMEELRASVFTTFGYKSHKHYDFDIFEKKTELQVIELEDVERLLSSALTELQYSAQYIGDDLDTEWVNLKDVKKIFAGLQEASQK